MAIKQQQELLEKEQKLEQQRQEQELERHRREQLPPIRSKERSRESKICLAKAQFGKATQFLLAHCYLHLYCQLLAVIIYQPLRISKHGLSIELLRTIFILSMNCIAWICTHLCVIYFHVLMFMQLFFTKPCSLVYEC